MNVEAINRVIAVCCHDNQPLQSPARSLARLQQLGRACGEDCGGLWQPSEWAAAVCHASFSQGRAAAVNSSADSCHPEVVPRFKSTGLQLIQRAVCQVENAKGSVIGVQVLCVREGRSWMGKEKKKTTQVLLSLFPQQQEHKAKIPIVTFLLKPL